MLTWAENVRHLYHNVELQHEEEPKTYAESTGPNHWTISRYIKLLQLRQKALERARSQWADYIYVSYYSLFT